VRSGRLSALVADEESEASMRADKSSGQARIQVRISGRTTPPLIGGVRPPSGEDESVKMMTVSGSEKETGDKPAMVCPGCGGEKLTARRYCRPSCEARHQHRLRPLIVEPLTFESEWPEEPAPSRRRRTR
jgi:hypothetical protein